VQKKKIKLNIKKYREKANISQSELARALGVSHSAVGKWDSGQGFPRADMLPRIATVLHCDIADFF
jgi:transcriptional regulator with XRE-family HTH domain